MKATHDLTAMDLEMLAASDPASLTEQETLSFTP